MVVDWSRGLAYSGPENLILMPWSGLRVGLVVGVPDLIHTPYEARFPILRGEPVMATPAEARHAVLPREDRSPKTLPETRTTRAAAEARHRATTGQPRTIKTRRTKRHGSPAKDTQMVTARAERRTIQARPRPEKVKP